MTSIEKTVNNKILEFIQANQANNTYKTIKESYWSVMNEPLKDQLIEYENQMENANKVLNTIEFQILKEKFDDTGILIALVAKGAQDKWTDMNPYVHCKQHFLSGTYNMVYNKLPYDLRIRKQKCVFIFKKGACDLINNIDLVIRGPLDSIISIESELGGLRFDKLQADDLKTQIKTNCAFLGQKREISYANGNTYIPLVMAPFYDHNLIEPIMEHMDLQIIVEFNDDCVLEMDPMLYGCMYVLEKPELLQIKEGYNFLTIQNQYTGVERVDKPAIQQCKAYKFNINFYHPTYLIYFWGFDKRMVTNVKFTINGNTFYDGTLDALEHYKNSRGFKDVDPCVIFFTDQNDFASAKPNKCNINFSRIDTTHLIIETSQYKFDMNIVGLSMQPVRCLSGMIGLSFSG